ncbi:MAG: hypothetical protein WA813_03450, partial [Beijerinckiaceae bacterium]
KARSRDRGNGSADNIRASGLNSPHKKAEDMTAPTTSATPKITLDLRVPSRHDNTLRSNPAVEGQIIGAHGREADWSLDASGFVILRGLHHPCKVMLTL